ncbi:MAG: HAD family hydrolase [Desulfobacterium sp.]|nr:HAD family hydrolase [Desulfobacterium sp.]
MIFNNRGDEGMERIRVIAFDADDTLWVNEPIFRGVKAEFMTLLEKYADAKTIQERLLAVERENIGVFGYGVKGFLLSLIETAAQVSQERLSGADIQKLIALGKEMLASPVELMDGVEAVLEDLCRRYSLMIITKGDLLDQESKIARSKLAPYFDKIEILSEKDETAYDRVLSTHGVGPREFMMVGNSLRSDVLPVVNLGGHAVHVPFATTWAHEQVAVSAMDQSLWLTLSHLGELPPCLPQRFSLAGKS